MLLDCSHIKLDVSTQWYGENSVCGLFSTYWT